MIKRVWHILACILMLYSCDKLVVQKDNRELLIQEKWAEIDTNEVEKPPLFKLCRFAADEELDTCFKNTITAHITAHLSDQTIVVNKAINDTIWIPIIITKDNQIKLEDFEVPEIITSQIPDFSKLLKESIINLPEIEAAHTRSTPVTTKYKLPLVININ